MNRLLRILMAGALVASFAAPAIAESELKKNVSRRIDLDLADAVPLDVFTTFAQMLGARLELSPAVGGKITVRLRNITVETAIDVVCESIDCRSDLVVGPTPTLRILPIPQQPAEAISETAQEDLYSKASLSLKDAKAMDVLPAFARMLNATLRVQGGSDRSITVELQNVPINQALDAVAAILKMDWRLREESVEGKLQRVLEFAQRTPLAPIAGKP